MTVIWDFNGTLLDDVEVCFECANLLAAEYNLKKLENIDEYRKIFGFPVIDYYRRLGFDFNKIPYEEPANKWVGFYIEREHLIPIREGIMDVVSELKMRGLHQTVISATEKEMLIGQMKRLNIVGFFDEIYGRDDIYAGGKPELAERWRRTHPNEKAVFIGDSVHDYECAEIIGCPCVLLKGGHEPLDCFSGKNAAVSENVGKLLGAIGSLCPYFLK